MGRRMRPTGTFFVIGILAAAAVLVGMWVAGRASEKVPEDRASAPESIDTEKRAVHLYFGDAQGRYLMAEQRMMRPQADAVGFGRQLIEALIRGPRKDGSRTLPQECRLRAMFFLPDGTAVVDLEPGGLSAHPGGAGTEILSIYSIVNTLVLNVESIRTVKLLIGGQETATLAGHVDIRQPFTANMLWVR